MSPKPIRAKNARTIAIQLDHRAASCPEGVTVLRAAELNGVFIPSLCSHKDLSPFGGCRLCMVEIDGMRGYPLACSTVVQDGMSVLTETTAIREMRRDILELMLSEHPSSCLICTEQAECRENQYTIRKSGVSTGCRTCPKDGQCELQSLVEKLGVSEIRHPVYYRGYEAEHDDPFFDRDYNLCILCGRCVRMCQEVRGASVLAFMNRGPKTQIGPAFGRSHVEAGCEFCGACVSVCPTGALVDKASKWDGKPDGAEISTCPFCALGCQVELHHKNGRLSKVHPHLDHEINDGQLCVRGRFCLPETTHHHERARKPVLKRGRYFREVDWPEALEDVASRLRGLEAGDFLMLISPDLTNESLYTAQKFVRSVLRTNSIDSTARWALPGGTGVWSRLFSLPISIEALAHADAIIAVGLDSRFYFSVAGVQIRRALREGAVLVTIDSRDSNLARVADHWLRSAPGMEGRVLRAMVERLFSGDAGAAPHAAAGCGIEEVSLAKAVRSIASCRSLAVVVSPSAFAVDPGGELAEALFRLEGREQTTFLPLMHGTNTRGALELGALGELLPGFEKADDAARVSLADVLEGRARPKVLYLVGEAPFFERPPCEYVIAQDIYLPPFEVDAFLPAASFVEAEGTLTNVEGRVQRSAAVEHLPDGARTGRVRPDWMIFSMLAETLSADGLHFANAGEVLCEISRRVAGFPASGDRRPRRTSPTVDILPRGAGAHPPADSARRLIAEPGGFRHRGIDLSHVVEGLSELRLEEGLRLHPDDLEELGVKDGDRIVVHVDGMNVTGTARADADCAPRSVTVHRPHAYGGLAHRQGLQCLYRFDGRLLNVTVSGHRNS
jgi:predicted molibdopterin-dependent oxidoreductase YjgC